MKNTFSKFPINVIPDILQLIDPKSILIELVYNSVRETLK